MGWSVSQQRSMCTCEWDVFGARWMSTAATLVHPTTNPSSKIVSPPALAFYRALYKQVPAPAGKLRNSIGRNVMVEENVST